MSRRFGCLVALAWLLAGLLWSALAAAADAPAVPECGQLTVVQTAQRTVFRGNQGMDTRTVTLPDRIPREWRTPAVRLQYELALPPCPGGAPRALLLSRVGGPYDIQALGPDAVANGPGVSLEPLGHQTLGADLAESDPSRVHARLNGRVGAVLALGSAVTTVRVSLLTLPNVGAGLIGVVTGPQQAVMRGPAQAHYRWQQFNLVASAVIGTVGLAALLVWWARRQSPQTLWFALACMCWSLRGQILQTVNIPVDVLLFEQVNPLLMWFSALLVTATTLSTLGYMRRVPVLLLGALGGAAVLGFGLSLAVPTLASLYRMTAFTLGFAVLLGMVGLLAFTLGRRATRPRPAHALWLMAGYSFVLVGATHDFLMILGLLQPGWWTLLTPGFTLLLLCHMVSVGLYLMHSLHSAEVSLDTLAQAIAEKSSELQASYAKRQSLELAHAGEAARTHEREHLLREMHDGIGAQLMVALRGVERGALNREQLASALQDGLDELRLLMDSADTQRELAGALAAWRNRWDARLSAAGVLLVWRVDDTIDQAQLGSDAVMQTMRILQEAAANILKHSGARGMTLSAWVDAAVGPPGGLLCIDIVDDGVGCPALGEGTVRSGARGLKNMRFRAQQIGAQLVVANRPAPDTGCVVTLRLPVVVQVPTPARA
ncbi:MAG: ATP-binding protein [Polaromonas sp.]